MVKKECSMKPHYSQTQYTKMWILSSFVCVFLLLIVAHLIAAFHPKDNGTNKWTWVNPYTANIIVEYGHDNGHVVHAVLWVLFWLCAAGAVVFHYLIWARK